MDRSASADSTSTGPNPDLLVCAALTAVWLLIVWFVGVHGEFPLNDDWAYSIPTKHLVETGRLERLPWTWTPILSHVAIGAVFAHLFGFSLVTMRMVGVVSGWVGMIGAYVLARRVGITRPKAVIATGISAWNPVYINLSFTYMLDVPITAMLTWSLVCLSIAAPPGNEGHVAAAQSALRQRLAWAGALLLALAATASRQTGVALIVAVAAAMGLSHLRRLWHLGAALALVAVLLWIDKVVAAGLFGHGDRGASAGIVFILGYLRDKAIFQILGYNTASVLFYLGLFAAPVVVMLVRWNDDLARQLLVPSVLLGSATLWALPKLGWSLLPAGFNVVWETGVGPLMIEPMRPTNPLRQSTWALITLISLCAVYYALLSVTVACFRAYPQLRRSVFWITLLVFPPVYLAPHLVRIPCFDRYLLPLLPVCAVLLLAMPGQLTAAAPRRLWLAATVLGLGMLFGVLGTRDYLQRSRAAWALVAQPLSAGVPPEDIDGGFEYRGFYRFEGPHERTRIEVREDYSQLERFILSFHARIDGYRPIAQRSYLRWIPFGRETITLHERLGAAP
ncbi:MAG TPA: hypothetical protein VF331_03235 [Polyangiales bacterium]